MVVIIIVVIWDFSIQSGSVERNDEGWATLQKSGGWLHGESPKDLEAHSGDVHRDTGSHRVQLTIHFPGKDERHRENYWFLFINVLLLAIDKREYCCLEKNNRTDLDDGKSNAR